MARAEILSEIKRAEEEAKASVAQANEEKNRRISEAMALSREIIRKAEEEASQNAESLINEARKKIKEERGKIIEKGVAEAEDIKKNTRKNIAKATKFILAEFERSVDA